MSYTIVLTTAEDIVAVVDSVLAKPQGCDKQFVCEFTELSESQAQNALAMSVQLSFLSYDQTSALYNGASFLSRLMITASNPQQRAAIFRLALEQYEPYITFKSRFIFTESAVISAKHIKTLYGIQSSFNDIKNTIISIATYSRSIIDEGANVYRLNPDTLSHLSALSSVMDMSVGNENDLIRFFGSGVYDCIDKATVFAPLSDAYCRSRGESIESGAIVMSAGNAFESFLVQLARDKNITLTGRNGIIQKAEALLLSKKHRGMVQYIGQIRNAADHGADTDEGGKVWTVSDETARIYPLIIASLIKNLLLRESGTITV